MTTTDPSMKVGTVCLVIEEPHREKGYRSIYGVFTDEAAARRDYGEPASDVTVRFDTLPLFAARPVPVVRGGLPEPTKGPQQ